MAFSDLRALRDNMVNSEIAVFSTKYSYNKVNCYIAFCLLTDEDRKNKFYKYALLSVKFIEQENFDNVVICPANSLGLSIPYGELRRFFNIQYDPNGYEMWSAALINSIGNMITPNIPSQTPELQHVNIHTVCKHENRNPNRVYRSYLMRHPMDDKGNAKCRTGYNAQLASIKFPKLYNLYRNDKHVSFCFTDDPNKEVSEQEAYDNFIRLEKHRL